MGGAAPVLVLGAHAFGNEVPHVRVDAMAAFNSSDWPAWSELRYVRSTFGTMNGPHEVYPVDGPTVPYDTKQYVESFKQLNAFAVRFNDMNYAEGALHSTSITQIFKTSSN